MTANELLLVAGIVGGGLAVLGMGVTLLALVIQGKGR